MALDELSYRFHPQWVTLSPWLFVGSRTRGRGQTSSNSQRAKQIWCLFAATLPSPLRNPPSRQWQRVPHRQMPGWLLPVCTQGAARIVPILRMRKWMVTQLVSGEPSPPICSQTLGPPRLVSLLWPCSLGLVFPLGGTEAPSKASHKHDSPGFWLTGSLCRPEATRRPGSQPGLAPLDHTLPRWSGPH